MYKIYSLLPGRFNEIWKKSKLTQRTVSKHLSAMIEGEIIQVEKKTKKQPMREWQYNEYKKNQSFENYGVSSYHTTWMINDSKIVDNNFNPVLSSEEKFKIKALIFLELSTLIKRRGQKQEIKKTSVKKDFEEYVESMNAMNRK